MVSRNTVAVLGIAALLLAAFVPLLPIVVCAIAIALIVPSAHPAPLHGVALTGDEQRVALRSVALFRAPPAFV